MLHHLESSNQDLKPALAALGMASSIHVPGI